MTSVYQVDFITPFDRIYNFTILIIIILRFAILVIVNTIAIRNHLINYFICATLSKVTMV